MEFAFIAFLIYALYAAGTYHATWVLLHHHKDREARAMKYGFSALVVGGLYAGLRFLLPPAVIPICVAAAVGCVQGPLLAELRVRL